MKNLDGSLDVLTAVDYKMIIQIQTYNIIIYLLFLSFCCWLFVLLFFCNKWTLWTTWQKTVTKPLRFRRLSSRYLPSISNIRVLSFYLCLSFCLSLYLSIYLCLSTYLSIYLSISHSQPLTPLDNSKFLNDIPILNISFVHSGTGEI